MKRVLSFAFTALLLTAGGCKLKVAQQAPAPVPTPVATNCVPCQAAADEPDTTGAVAQEIEATEEEQQAAQEKEKKNCTIQSTKRRGKSSQATISPSWGRCLIWRRQAVKASNSATP